jgi:hypothetical protein
VISSPSSGQQQSVEKLCSRSCSARDGTGGPRIACSKSIGKKWRRRDERLAACPDLDRRVGPTPTQPHARHVCVMDAPRACS